jgi:hypothetical protein
LADGPLALLLLLAVALFVAIGRFVVGHGLTVDPLVTCQTVASTVFARLSSFGLLLPAGLAASALIAAGLSLSHQLLATRRVLRRVLARRMPLDRRLRHVAAATGLTGRLDLIDDDAVYTFCYGLRRPRVCVSRGLAAMLDDAEMRAVLRHEAHHSTHHDPFKILFGRALASGLFFLPLAGALRNGYLAGKEICADRDASAGRVAGEQALARALLKLLQADRPVWPSGVLAIGALSPTEARLRQLVEPAKTARVMPTPADWIVSAMVLAGVFGFGHGSVAAATAPPVILACEPVSGVPLAPATLVAAAEFNEEAVLDMRSGHAASPSLAAPTAPNAPAVSNAPLVPVDFTMDDANTRIGAGTGDC